MPFIESPGEMTTSGMSHPVIAMKVLDPWTEPRPQVKVACPECGRYNTGRTSYLQSFPELLHKGVV
jgi:hypothetical protein